MFEQILDGFLSLAHPVTFLHLIGGFLLGLLFSVIPGLTATLAIALLLPFTFGMEVTDALVMVAGIYMAGIYSGSITGITLNIPGAPSGAVTTLDGHALMKKGEGSQALGVGALSSAIGGLIGTVVLVLLAQPISSVALLFQTPDKFSLVLLAIVTVTIVGTGSLLKAAIAMAVGLMISSVGMDPMAPVGRFDFGSYHLIEGVGLLPAVIGLFAISEMITQSSMPSALSKASSLAQTVKHSRREFLPRKKHLREIGLFNSLKSSVIGVLVGMLPGGGASMASFIAYAEAKRTARTPEMFGKGSYEGLAASESANNGMCGGAIIPLLTMGIPGDAVTAIIFGVLLIHGLVPGPELLASNFDVVAPMFAALFVTSIFIFFSVLVFGPLYMRLTTINRGLLYSFIALVAMVGVYASTFSIFQMWVALSIGILGFLLRVFGYPVVPVLMGIILGPYLEEFLRRSLIVSGGDPIIFLSSPPSAVMLALTVLFIWLLRVKPARQAKIKLGDK